ncbi:unnamed protein product [Arabidopsis halleri]
MEEKPLGKGLDSGIYKFSWFVLGHAEAVLYVSFIPDGKQLASGLGNTILRLSDLKSETPLFTCKC